VAALVFVSDSERSNSDNLARIQFSQSNSITGEYKYYEGVYYTDLYAEYIAAEASAESASDDFTTIFADTDDSRWVCPNVAEITIEEFQPLVINVLPCGNANYSK